jgi:hypothetical protein
VAANPDLIPLMEGWPGRGFFHRFKYAYKSEFAKENGTDMTNGDSEER